MTETKSNESVDDLRHEFDLIGCYGLEFFDEGFIVKFNYFFYQVIDNRKTCKTFTNLCFCKTEEVTRK